MKRIYIIITLASLFLMQGCDKFLELKPENIQIVRTVEDYRDILASYMRLLKTINPSQEPVLGGNQRYPLFNTGSIFAFRTGELVISKNQISYYDPSLGEYTQLAINEMTWLGHTNDCWRRYYSFLGPINMIIDGITTASGNNEQLRDYVKGEALVWRAYSYFKLLQYYSPYKKNEYGIPVFLKPYEKPEYAMPARETQTQVYKQILADCKEVIDLMERTPSATWNYAYEPRFVYGMLASIYCYKALGAAAEEDDWQNALGYADKAIAGRTFVRDQDTYTSLFDATVQQAFTHDEFYFRLIDKNNAQIANLSNLYYYSSPTYAKAIANPDIDFYAKYKNDDVRKKTYFKTKPDGSIIFDKYNFSASSSIAMRGAGIIMLFRTAELQLIKAEALFRTGQTAEARKALNEFKQGRYTDIEGSYTESDLLEEILKERKLEFYHEGDMWWLDMKRTGAQMERVLNGTRYVLEPDDFRYCFPIPQNIEMDLNKNIVQNPGWDKILNR